MFRISEGTGIAINTTYTVDVDVFYNGSWVGYGATCNITTPALLIALHISEAEGTLTGDGEAEDAPATAGLEEQTTDKRSIVAFPNPFETSFRLDFVSDSEEMIEIKVFDATGKVVEGLQVTKGELPELKFGENYQPGMYLLTVLQGTHSKHLKVIKN